MNQRLVRVHPDVLGTDFSEALAYYGGLDDATLPMRLAESFAQAMTQAREHPLTGREYLADYRRVVAIPFPYLLAYYVDDESVFVAGFLHAKRDPATNRAVLERRRNE